MCSLKFVWIACEHDVAFGLGSLFVWVARLDEITMEPLVYGRWANTPHWSGLTLFICICPAHLRCSYHNSFCEINLHSFVHNIKHDSTNYLTFHLPPGLPHQYCWHLFPEQTFPWAAQYKDDWYEMYVCLLPFYVKHCRLIYGFGVHGQRTVLRCDHHKQQQLSSRISA